MADTVTTIQMSNQFSFPDNKTIRLQARNLLTGRWKQCAVLTLIFFACCLLPGSIRGIGQIISLLIGGPFALGLAGIFLKIIRKEEFIWKDLFNGFATFTKAFLAYVIILVLTILWLILLIVPGVIAALSYSLTFYLMADNPSLSANEARLLSMKMMIGHKKRLFFLGISFIGWFLLGVLSVGIGFLWIFPYFNTSMALFYQNVANAETKNN